MGRSKKLTPPTPAQLKRMDRNKKRRAAKKQQRGQGKKGPRQISKNGFQTMKQARSDPRNGPNAHTSIVSTTSLKTIAQQCELGPSSLLGFAIGYVTRALEKGYQTFDSEVNNPFFAFLYIIDLLSQFCTGGVPAVQKLPYCMLAMGRALTQKSVPLGQSTITYSYKTDFVTSPSTPIVPFTSGVANWNIGYVPPAATVTYVDGFPIINLTLATPVTDGLKQAAFSEMNQFLLNKMGADSPFRLVGLDEKTSLDSDVSAFACRSNPNGTGFNGPDSGAWISQANLEVPIFRPFLTTLGGVPLNDVANLNRWGNQIVDVSGDSITIGAHMGEGEGRWDVKKNIQMTFVDFDELVDSLAKWVSTIQTAAVNDPTGQWVDGGPVDLICPLSLQEVSLLLRNTMMNALKHSQCGVQGISPVLPSALQVAFIPFVCGSGTCPLEPVEWKLPRMFVENLKSFVSRTTDVKTKPCIYETVLGRSALNAVDTIFYTYSWQESGPNLAGSSQSFTIPTYRRKFKGPKGAEEWKMVPETPISMIDGSFTSGSATAFAAINNPNRLRELAQMWDDWLTTRNLSSYSGSLVTFGTDPGVNILYSGMTNRFVSYENAEYKSGKEKKDVTSTSANSSIVNGHHIFSIVKDDTEVDLRQERRRRKTGINTFYSLVPGVADVSSGDFQQAAYEQIQSFWVLPVLPLIGGPGIQGYSSVRIQSMMRQGFLQNASSGFDGQNLDALHEAYAKKMAKSKMEPQSDIDRFLDEMDKGGNAGILSSLVGNALGALFPKAKDTINTIAEFVPF